MPTPKDKLKVMQLAKVLMRGVAENEIDFDASDAASLKASTEELFRLERIGYAFFVAAWNDKVRLPDPPAGYGKYELLLLAAESAATALMNVKDALPVDVTVTDPATVDLQNKVWQACETAYQWLVATVDKDNYWGAAPDTGGKDAAAGALDPSLVAVALKASLTLAAGKELIEAVRSVIMGGSPPATPATPADPVVGTPATKPPPIIVS